MRADSKHMKHVKNLVAVESPTELYPTVCGRTQTLDQRRGGSHKTTESFLLPVESRDLKIALISQKIARDKGQILDSERHNL